VEPAALDPPAVLCQSTRVAGADAWGGCGGQRAAVLLIAIAVSGGCSIGAASDPANVSVPPPVESGASGVPPAPRSAQTATRIVRVSIESAPPTTRVVLELDGTAEPEVSLLVNNRLVVDVPNTSCALLPRIIGATGDPLVERVRTGQHAAPDARSRVVIDLRQRADFSVRAQGNRIVAYLSPADGTAASASDDSRILLGAELGDTPGAASTPAPERTALPAAAATSVDGAPPATIAASAALPPPAEGTTPDSPSLPATDSPPTSEPLPTIDPPPTSEQVRTSETATTTAPQAALAPGDASVAGRSAPIPQDVAGTPSAELEAPADAAAGLAPPPEPTQPAALVEPSDAPVPVATPEPSQSTAPLVEATHAAAKRISIDFAEADVRTVIELVAGAGGYSVVFAPEVGGTITVSLVDRPWEDALATVLRAKRLREVRHQDIMFVSPAGR